MLPKLLSWAAMALFCTSTVSIAFGEDATDLERVLAKIKSEPMIFVAATGEPSACGQGCSEWIAGEGEFDAGAAQRLREFLAGLPKRDLPIFFNSDGGLVAQAVQIGLILRENRMTAGVARTVPEGCRLGAPIDEACRQLMQSKPQHKARLYFGSARCASACVYAMIGGSTRHVDPAATLRIHSGLGPDIGKMDNFLQRYLIQMGVDPALVDAAGKIPSRTYRGLSRGEMERFGIETRGVYETPWFAEESKFLLLKSITSPGGRDGSFQTRTIGLTCAPLHPEIRLMFHQELAKEIRSSPTIRAKIGESFIDLTAAQNIKEESVDKFVDFDPRKLQAAIETGGFVITESFNPSVIEKPDEVIKFSTSGLSDHIGVLQSKCTSDGNAHLN